MVSMLSQRFFTYNFVLYSCSLQLRSASNLLRQEQAILVRWFSHDVQPSSGKLNGMPFLCCVCVKNYFFLSICYANVAYH